MAIDYVLHWTDDALKQPFKLTAQATNSTVTSLILSGKGSTNWGEIAQQDMIRLLENFCSNDHPPILPTVGQLWFNKAQNILKCFWNGRWNDVGYQRIDSDHPPLPPNFSGDLWYDTENDILKVYNSNGSWDKVYQGGLPQAETYPIPTSPTSSTPAPTTTATPTTTPAPTTTTPAPTTTTPAPTTTTPVPTTTSVPTTTPIPTTTPAPLPTKTPNGYPAPVGQDGSLYEMNFNDEFDGDLNTQIWNNHLWYEQSDPAINYAVENSCLKIWPQYNANGLLINRTLDTDGKLWQSYGYVEFRAKLPRGKGVWPRIWMYTHEVDPYGASIRPEIDLMEAFASGGIDNGWSDVNNNPMSFQVSVIKGPNAYDIAGSKQKSVSGLSSQFHTFGIKWVEGNMKFFCDGVLFYDLDVLFDNRLYFLVSLMFGSTYSIGGAPDSTTPVGNTNAFEIDYLRSWKFI